MKQMRYRGFGRREISSADFAKHDVKSKDIAANQGDVIEVTDAVAAWLNEYEAADWQEISEREAARMEKEAAEKAAKEAEFAAAQAKMEQEAQDAAAEAAAKVEEPAATDEEG